MLPRAATMAMNDYSDCGTQKWALVANYFEKSIYDICEFFLATIPSKMVLPRPMTSDEE